MTTSYKNLATAYKITLKNINASAASNRRFAGYIYIILTLFTVSVFGLFAITPTLSTISNLQKKYEDNQRVYEALKTKLESINKLDIAYKGLGPDLPAIFLAIPRSSKIPYLTRQLENIADSEQVVISRLGFGTIELYPSKKTNQPLFSYTFSLVVSGPQKNVNNFLKGLISFDRIVSINRLTTGTENNTYQASITGNVYFFDK